jgi:hypothetical protein
MGSDEPGGIFVNPFKRLFGSRVQTVGGRSGNNNGLGTFLKGRSRWYWNSSRNGTFYAGKNEAKRAQHALHGVRK